MLIWWWRLQFNPYSQDVARQVVRSLSYSQPTGQCVNIWIMPAVDVFLSTSSNRVLERRPSGNGPRRDKLMRSKITSAYRGPWFRNEKKLFSYPSLQGSCSRKRSRLLLEHSPIMTLNVTREVKVRNAVQSALQIVGLKPKVEKKVSPEILKKILYKFPMHY